MSDQLKDDQAGHEPDFLPGDPFDALSHEGAPPPASPPPSPSLSEESPDLYPPDLGGGD